ncbi:protease inhibitor I42 family protein [Asaia sp. BMEF1]|uniref:protease inhibitor I42 family protein n=1 Tax=Asaia sp. BMEF1 TaxID=3155932 RepID=UPI003F67720E
MRSIVRILSVGITTCFSTIITVSHGHASESFQKKINAYFSLDLPQNPSTAYSWVVTSLPQNLALAGMDYREDKDCNGRLGCGGSLRVTFRVI